MGDRTPRIALLLGWGGVIPFAAAALAWLFGDPVMRIHALNLGTIYGGVIIAFLGAVHWGIAIERGSATAPPPFWPFIWSVLPSLAVVPVLAISPLLRPGFILAGLVICWGVDFYLTSKGRLPRWYMNLRHGLTGAAAITMLVMLRV